MRPIWTLGIVASVTTASLFLIPKQSLAEDWTIGPAVSAVVNEAIIPIAKDHMDASAQLSQHVSDLCEVPSADTLAMARETFRETVYNWGRLEHVRLGPLSAENRLERTLYWPDRKGRGLRQVQAAIATESADVTTAESISGQSVAVQGLLALDFILAGSGSDALAVAAPHRCAFGLAAAVNVNYMAQDIHEAWTSETGIANLWQNPASDNPLFRDPDEQVRALLKILGDGAEAIIVQRVDPFLTSEPFNHKRALFWRSSATFHSLRGNVDGLQLIERAARLEKLVEGDFERIVDGMAFELSQATRVLRDFDTPVEDLGDDQDAFGKIRVIRTTLDGDRKSVV